jgi:hypothetical protein
MWHLNRGFCNKNGYMLCRNPSLGLATKARGCKVMGQEGDLGALHMLPGVQRVWGHEPSHSQVNSHVGSWSPKRTFESSELDCRGQNSSARRVLYIIGKLLKCRCLKWAQISRLDICNTSYGQMNGRESNWLPTTKSRESTRFTWVKETCNIPLKSSRRGLQLFFRPRCDRRFAQEVMRPQSCGSPGWCNWESWDKKPFGCGSRGKAHSIL